MDLKAANGAVEIARISRLRYYPVVGLDGSEAEYVAVAEKGLESDGLAKLLDWNDWNPVKPILKEKSDILIDTYKAHLEPSDASPGYRIIINERGGEKFDLQNQGQRTQFEKHLEKEFGRKFSIRLQDKMTKKITIADYDSLAAIKRFDPNNPLSEYRANLYANFNDKFKEAGNLTGRTLSVGDVKITIEGRTPLGIIYGSANQSGEIRKGQPIVLLP